MDKKYDVMAAGHLCLDIVPRIPETGITEIQNLLSPGKLVNVEDCKISTGGPVSNTGLGLEKLGAKVNYCARIGNDIFGKMIIELLNEHGGCSGISVSDTSATSYTVVLAPPGIDRVFLHNPAANNEFCADDLQPEAIKECKHFHLGYPPLMRRMMENEGEELLQILKTVQKLGVTTSCDMALPDPSSESGKQPWDKILQKILPHIDMYLPSVEECLYMLEKDTFLEMKQKHNNADLIDFLTEDDYSRISGKLLDMGPKFVTLKTGHRGFYLRTRDGSDVEDLCKYFSLDYATWAKRELWIPAYKVEKLASATGSGDSTIAGFLRAVLAATSIEDAMKSAVCLGWQNVQYLDALSGIKSWEETQELTSRGMPVLDIKVTSPDWHYAEALGVYVGPNNK